MVLEDALFCFISFIIDLSRTIIIAAMSKWISNKNV